MNSRPLPSHVCRFAGGSSSLLWLATAASLAVGAGCLATSSAHAVVIVNWQQTGADVTATLSGTVDAAWGSPTQISGSGGAGGLTNAFGGYGFGQVRVGYGGYTAGYDRYVLSPTSFSPSISVTGAQLSGGVVQTGYTPSYASLDISPTSLVLNTLPGTTSFNTSIVWSNKQLSDFFASGIPLMTDISNSSSQKLVSLQIGVVPEPSAYALALAGLTCGSYLVRRRRTRA